MTYRQHFQDAKPHILAKAIDLRADGKTNREAAVYAVDGHYGFTMEFAPCPAAHAAEWDEVEQILIDADTRL